MSNDFKKKMPTKNEQVIYDLAMHLQDVDYRVYSISSHVLALGIVLGVDPKKMAEILTGNDSKIKEYAKNINDEIQKIEESKKTESDNHAHDGHAAHNHAHDHSDDDSSKEAKAEESTESK